MRKKKFTKLFILVLVLFIGTSLNAQIEDNLQRYAEDNGKGYIQPLVNGLAVSMNRGWYHSGHVPELGLRLKVGVVGMVAPVLDKDRTFVSSTEGVFNPSTTAKVPTIVGSEESVTVTGTGGTKYTFPGGLNMDMTGFAVPQLTVGSLLGTEATVRYFAAELGDTEIGDVKLIGLGVRHSLSQYLFYSPIDVSLGVFWQSIKVGDDLLQFKTLYMGLQASRGFGPLILYGGVGYDQSTASINYEYTDANQNTLLSYDMKGDDGIEYTMGLGLKILLVHLNGDFTFGKRTVYTVGLSIGY